jgi:hypothetical protein
MTYAIPKMIQRIITYNARGYIRVQNQWMFVSIAINQGKRHE